MNRELASPHSPSLVPATLETSWSDYLELTKPRLSLLSVLTAVVGYFVARPAWDAVLFFSTVLGTSLSAAGVAALNQWMESDTDARMHRTADRPIPAGKIPTGSVFVLGWGLCAAGLALLFAKVGGLAAFFSLATMVCYLALYTPAKRWSRWSTEIGAVAGALPPLIGWAASGSVQLGLAGILFGILFFWQMPHFMAVAWTYRKDYEAVHFPMLAVRDSSGAKVARYSLLNTLAVVLVSASAWYFGLASFAYLLVTLALGGWFISKALRFTRAATREKTARSLFFASIIWLPLQLTALVVDRCLFQA